MSLYYTVRGWVEMDDDQCEQLRRIIAEDEDSLGHYRESWCFPTRGGGGTKFAFFGSAVREGGVPSIRGQLERIATSVKSLDGDTSDFVRAQFLATLEDESLELTWLCRDGTFTETVRVQNS